MSLLSYNSLIALVAAKVITNVEHGQVNSASIDITLGSRIMVELKKYPMGEVSLRDRQPLSTIELSIPEGGYVLEPGEFILAQSEQVFNLPDYISAEYKLKSSMARIGLEHLNAGWCDAGWNGSVLTLELKNMSQYHSIRLHAGVGIGQMVFFRHDRVPEDRSYAARGRYNGDTTVSGIKE